MKPRSEKASTPLQRILFSAACCVAGGYLMGLLANFIPQEGRVAMPFTIIGILLAPITLNTTLLFKLIDSKKIKGLSRQERRRLESIVTIRARRILILISLCFASAIAIAILFFYATLPVASQHMTWIFRASGAAITMATISSILALMDSKRASDFETTIANRSAERKAKAALLKRLQEEKPSK